MSKSVKGGILLILAAVLLLLNQLGVIPGQIFLYLLSFGFIATYVLLGARKDYGNVGFLIPGTVLLSMAIFSTLSGHPGLESFSPAYFFLGLSLSFAAVFVVHTYWFKDMESGERFWPVYPAGGLLLFAGMISLGLSGWWVDRLNLLNYLWILILIAIGSWLIVSSLKKK